MLSFYYTSLKLLDRCKKHAKMVVLKYWDELGPEYMSEEGTVEEVFIKKYTPIWRSDGKPSIPSLNYTIQISTN